MTIEWHDKYSSGLDQIDDQHKQLFAFVNRLETMIDEGVESGAEVDDLLAVLGAYIDVHFSFEELCMKNRNCPVAAENKAAHKGFHKFYHDFMAQYEEEGFSAALLKKLHTVASDWIVNHICKIDIHLRSCVQEQSG